MEFTNKYKRKCTQTVQVVKINQLQIYNNILKRNYSTH